MMTGTEARSRWAFPETRSAAASRAPSSAGARPIADVAAHPLVRAALVVFSLSIAFDLPRSFNPLGIELPTATAMLLIATSLLDPRRCYRHMPASAYGFLAHLWVFVVVVIALSVPYGALVARYFVNLVVVLILFVILTNLLEDRRLLRSALLALVIGCGLRAAIQLAGFATVESTMWTGGVRVTTFGQNANLSAIILAGGLVVVLGWRWSALSPPRWLMLLGWPLAAMMTAAIIQTGSRGGLFAALLGVSVYLMRGATILTRLRNAVLTALALVLIALAAWNTPMMHNRIEESRVEGRLAGREQIYPAAIGMFLERPVLGWGPIANTYEIGRRFPNLINQAWRDAHNLTLELVTSTGIAGAAPFLLSVLAIVIAAWKARRGEAGLLPLALVVATLAGTLSGTWITSKVMWLGFAVAIATARRAAADPPRLEGGH